jgi:hypothetical protein
VRQLEVWSSQLCQIPSARSARKESLRKKPGRNGRAFFISSVAAKQYRWMAE